MAGITALNKIRRQQAAFGGVMGKDGRKAYVGGSYSTKGTSDGKERGSYQGKDDSGKGYGGTYSGGGDGPDRSAVEKGSQYYAANNPQPKAPKEKKKLNIPNFKDMYKGYNKFRYNTVNSLIPGQKERIQKYRKAYAKYLKDQGVQVPENLLDEDLSSYFFDGAFDKNQITDPRPSMRPDHMDYGTFMATKMGSPGIKYAGNVGGLGDKYVTKRGPDGRPLEYGYTNVNESGNLILGRGEGGGQSYLPFNYGVGVGPVEEKETQTFEFDPSRFGAGAEAADVTRASYIFNQGGRVPRNMGGIMNAVPRQGFFLGKIAKGIGKAVGSVAKAAGKVLKSDFGKAALAAGAFAYGPKLFGATKLGGFGGYTELIPKMADNKFLSAMLLNKDQDGFNPFKVAGLFGLGASAFMPTKVDQMPGGGGGGGKMLDSRGNEVIPSQIRAEIDEAYESGDAGRIKEIESYYAFLPPRNQFLPYPNYAVGGRVAAQEGGLMNLGGMEKDYRNEGGFVPIGKQEKADDVPARLSVNEFVFTADAVRNAGGGDIDRGAEVMENMMKNLENGGRVSEESQGNTGAQDMFSVSERIGEVI